MPEYVKFHHAPTKAELIAKAAELGATAFENGIRSAPAVDVRLMRLIQDYGSGEIGWSTPLLDAWAKAWHKANLAAPY